ncbi:MAG: D-alanyl-D-alanine carboxypeptidase family protein [Jatrophihabitans sp.]|uniref:D-alanyl-D-alanine carboxypeptidase family protein n=1 Tax=Jatrophihabitans sp. TaxID=1932789 RepID=UPI003F7ECFC3
MHHRPHLRAWARAAAAAAAAASLLTASPALAAPSPSYTYPPIAPRPTADANSPEAPDPHPPAGGLGPDDRIVGGDRLARRGVITPAGAPRLPGGLTAQAWMLVDLDRGTVLAARDPHGRYQPASILKLLTCDTVLPKLPGDMQVVASRTAAETEGSHAGLVAKGHYTVDDLFRGLLLVSGNDTAVALAEAAGGVPQTVAAMNREALALGAYDTYVETPSGLDGWKQLTSAYDMALFLRAALQQPRFVAYDRTIRAFLPFQPVVGKVELDNQNATWLQTVPGALVAKTGYTDAARHTYVAAMQRGGRTLGVVFLRAERWPLDQWQQADRLFDWGFRLPAGTPAVGRLAGPVQPAATVRQAPQSTPQRAATHPAAARTTASSGLSTTAKVLIAVAVFAAIVLVALCVGRRHDAAHTTRRRRKAVSGTGVVSGEDDLDRTEVVGAEAGADHP